MALQPSASSGGAAAPRPTAVADQEGHADHPEHESESEDIIDQILENYNFTCHPEMRLKFKQQWVVKPTGGTRAHRLLQKVLVVPTHGLLCVYSSKIPLSFLRIQFMASYNWINKRPTLDYRITTKWSDGARIKRKERYHIGKHALLRCKWNMDLQLPDMEGHLGTDINHVDPWDVDYGRLDFEISQLDLVLNSPWGQRPCPSHALSPAQTQQPGVRDTSGVGRDASGVDNGKVDKRGRRQPPVTDGNDTQQGAGAREQRHHQPGQASVKEDRGGAATGRIAGQAAKEGKEGAARSGAAASLPGAGGAGQMEGGVPEWLITFLSKLSVKPYAPPT